MNRGTRIGWLIWLKRLGKGPLCPCRDISPRGRGLDEGLGFSFYIWMLCWVCSVNDRDAVCWVCLVNADDADFADFADNHGFKLLSSANIRSICVIRVL